MPPITVTTTFGPAIYAVLPSAVVAANLDVAITASVATSTVSFGIVQNAIGDQLVPAMAVLATERRA